MGHKQILFLEFNEVNFDYINSYIERGHLPAFRAFLDQHGFSETTSEHRYEDLEPWVQWVTAHTGLTLEEHGVFRLGDIVNHNHVQIWERLEALGHKIGAISPMNAKCRTENAAFFLPDPWTPTDVLAPKIFQRLFRAIAQAVNDNAQARMTIRSALDLLLGGAIAAAPRNYGQYLRYLARSRGRPWLRALFLDLLLADLFRFEISRTSPNFATLFLNAAAHVQHHYLFSSPVYDGPLRNPEWYLSPGEDPLLDAYKLYDRILADLQRRFPAARIMLATGLRQVPHRELQYYWRLKDHGAFLRKIGATFSRVEPRMSRDFMVYCNDKDMAAQAARRLEQAQDPSGVPLFEVDNRGDDLFVMLTYPHEIEPNFAFRIGNELFEGLKDDVAFVAIKNGAHNGIGYFADSGASAAEVDRFALKEIPDRVVSALAA